MDDLQRAAKDANGGLGKPIDGLHPDGTEHAKRRQTVTEQNQPDRHRRPLKAAIQARYGENRHEGRD